MMQFTFGATERVYWVHPPSRKNEQNVPFLKKYKSKTIFLFCLILTFYLP